MYYRSLNAYLRETFGCKVYKLALSAGCTCPNRDGTLDARGCIFCSGSGEFAASAALPVSEQLAQAKRLVAAKAGPDARYIAYFQDYSNTYAPADQLRPLFLAAIDRDEICALSIATRPDCLPPDVLHLLAECNRIKPVIVELGLQTSSEATAQFIRRGYPLSVYDDAATKLKGLGIEVVTHVIAGLPGETKQDFYNTLSHVAACHSDGIKIQLLHILKGTDLAALYESGQCTVLTQEEYIDLVLQSIALLPPEITIHRLTGDGPKELLLAPLWSSRKREVLNEIHKQLKQQNIWQGKEYKNHE